MKIYYDENGLTYCTVTETELPYIEVTEEEWQIFTNEYHDKVGDAKVVNGELVFQPHIWTQEEKDTYYNAVMSERRSIRRVLLIACDTVEIKSITGSEEYTDEIKTWKQLVLDLKPEGFINVPERIKFYANYTDEQIADMGHPKTDFDKDHNVISL